MRALSLDARLLAVAGMVPPCECAADIGADHGFLGAHLLLTGRCARVQFVDISPDSLEKARRLTGKLRLSHRAAFLVGDGAAALDRPVDAAVMAGLGAQVICGMVARGREKLADARLILAPNLEAGLVRRFLMENGYEIYDEALVAQGRRFYPVIAARPGGAVYSPLELLAGPVLLKKRPESLRNYASNRVRIVSRALVGAERGEEIWADDLREELSRWREVLYDDGFKNSGTGQ